MYVLLFSMACEADTGVTLDLAPIPVATPVDTSTVVEAIEAKQAEQDARLAALVETVAELHGEEAAELIEQKTAEAQRAADAVKAAADLVVIEPEPEAD